jgi:sacsin
VIALLNKTGKKVVTVPVNVTTALEQYCTSSTKNITPKLLRNSLKEDPSCYCNLSYEDKILLLKYILSDSDFKDLEGLELLPLSDKTFTTFQPKNYNVPIYIDSSDHPKSLLPGLQRMFLDTEMDDTVIKQLKNAVKKGN